MNKQDFIKKLKDKYKGVDETHINFVVKTVFDVKVKADVIEKVTPNESDILLSVSGAESIKQNVINKFYYANVYEYMDCDYLKKVDVDNKIDTYAFKNSDNSSDYKKLLLKLNEMKVKIKRYNPSQSTDNSIHDDISKYLWSDIPEPLHGDMFELLREMDSSDYNMSNYADDIADLVRKTIKFIK